MVSTTDQKKWPMVMQYPIVAVLVALATAFTQAAGVYCQFESKPYFARLWVRLLHMHNQSVITMLTGNPELPAHDHPKSLDSLGRHCPLDIDPGCQQTFD